MIPDNHHQIFSPVAQILLDLQNDVAKNQKIKQAEAELGQAQPKLRLRLKLEDFN